MRTPHIHADIIKAWADGATIQMQLNDGRWVDDEDPCWSVECINLRIKPESKSDTVWNYNAFEGLVVRCDADIANLKLTFDGETGKLKSAEVIE
jgi:hypothetical protein